MQPIIDKFNSLSLTVKIVLIVFLLPLMIFIIPIYLIWTKTQWSQKIKIIVTVGIVAVVLLAGAAQDTELQNTLSHIFTESSSVDTSSYVSATTKKQPKTVTTITAATQKSNNPYVELSKDKDSYLLLLTSIGECYINNKLTAESLNKMQSNKIVTSLVQNILKYKDNQGGLSPEFSESFTQFSKSNNELKDYPKVLDVLSFSFDLKYSPQDSGWTLIPKEEYMDALGYLAKGIKLYINEDDNWVCCFEVLDLKYNCTIEENYYPMAVEVRDVETKETYWKDADAMLNMNRKLTGEPMYYIRFDDPNLPKTKILRNK